MSLKFFLWIMYMRLRISIGIFGIVILYGSYTGVFSLLLLLIGIGFFFIELFGGTYNDYLDYEEDKKNNRKEKWTVSGLMTVRQIKYFSFLVLAIGLSMLLLSGLAIFLVGLYYMVILLTYSHPRTRLKNYNIIGYLIFVTMWLFFPFGMALTFGESFSIATVIFAFFCFFQYAYILAQKDSTDMKDNTNLFLERGWNKSFWLCALFAFITSVFFLFMNLHSLFLICFVWSLNVLVKAVNLNKIYSKTITRKVRSRLILLDYLTPYLYALVNLL